MVQYGFFFDQGRCTACGECTLACKSWNNIPPGPEKWIRSSDWETGTWPNVTTYTAVVMCWHCQDPKCIDVAEGALIKEDKYGAVLLDPDKAKSHSLALRKANEVCPYAAILFESDASDARASKCTMCVDRLEQGLIPICVNACNFRALDFGRFEELQKKHGITARTFPDYPSGDTTKAAAIFKPREPHKKILPYDSNKAVELWQNRSPMVSLGPKQPKDLGPLFESVAQATEPEPSIVRSKFVIRPKNAEELMLYTTNDT
jgi:anaerobic dimethyl sulfoxide reductase subunit B (iron-sulfur subunit)